MRINQLKLQQIRLYEASSSQFVPGMNILFGANGVGKTTLLEAVYYLGKGASFRASRIQEIIRTEYTKGSIEARTNEPNSEFRIALRPGGRSLYRDGKAMARTADFLRDANVVALAPEHRGIVTGGPKNRREFLDHLIQVLEPPYLETTHRYDKALKHKRALLRQELPLSAFLDRVEPWNEELKRRGQEMQRHRQALVAKLGPILRQTYSAISPGTDELSITYEPQDEDFSAQITTGGEVEHRAGRVLFGPHRDDLILALSQARNAAMVSQGESASILLALKLVELQLTAEADAADPILLLDDVGATLDIGRREHLFDLLAKRTGQTIVTTAETHVAEAANQAGGTFLTHHLEESQAGFSFARWLPAW